MATPLMSAIAFSRSNSCHLNLMKTRKKSRLL